MRALLTRITAAFVAAFAATNAAGASAAGTPRPLQFNRDVRPILSDTCFKCHGFDKKARKADLRLDVADEAFKVRKHGAPIVPGHLEQSEAYRRFTSADPEQQMPPPASHLSLSDAQKSILKRWIEEGAAYQPHWAFIPPQESPLPEVKESAWITNPIDRFILARLEQEGLKPSKETDRRTLIRRVTLDLTGLPPTEAGVNDFLADQSTGAYEKVVDRLLASPRYGERMSADWLDAARYADSNGYQADPTRTMWPWRDWVVSAMNANLPFDQFAVAQIAGDLLPNATNDQRLASGFNRNHPYNGEGGAISEEVRVTNVLDRVDTTASTFLGLTVGCAKCHDHKYDPITQKDYYSLYAYFNQCSENGNNPGAGGNAQPTMIDASAEDQKKLEALKESRKQAEAQLAAALPAIDAAQAEWEKSTGHPPEFVTVVPTSVSSMGKAWIRQIEDGTILAGGTSPITDVQTVVLKTDLIGVTAVRLDALPHPSLPHEGPGRALENGNFVLTEVDGEAVSTVNPKETRKLAFTGAFATYSQQGWPASAAVDGNSKTGWAVMSAPDKDQLSATFTLGESVGFAGGTELRVQFHYESEHPYHTMGHFRVAIGTGPVVPGEIAPILAVERAKRNDAQKNKLRDYYRVNVDPQYKSLNNAVALARKAAEDLEQSFPHVMVMDDATRRETHVLNRGQYDKPADKVEPGAPAVLNTPLPKDVPNNRLALARWLVDPANPLTARVIVNRYWQGFFGVGIVKTSDDFGTQGEPPTHLELLDWLAYRFVAGGWDVKAMHRLIVTSSTYRQSSKMTPELLERDPANRLLGRGPRYRLSSFAIRDQALAASGLLVEKVGGKPVKPYQPPGVWEEMSLGQIRYDQDHGDALYRRSLYTFWRRTVAPAGMFDVSPRTVCIVKPSRTNTPLQALTLENDPTFVEAARVLSETLLKERAKPVDTKINTVFQRFLARPATDAEQTIVKQALERLTTEFRAEPARATQLISVGERPRDLAVDPVELASWTAIVNTVMNMDQVITKE